MKLAKREVAPAGLMKVEEARAMLAQCVRVDEAKSIRDKAGAIQAYLRQQSASREAQNDAAEIKLRAERRLGDLIGEQEKAKGGATKGVGRKGKCPDIVSAHSVPTLQEQLGTDTAAAAQQLSKRWQDVAKVPEKKFEEYVATQREQRDGEITTAGLFKKPTHVSQNTGQVEWYTPPEFIEAARKVLGGIDLDPATSKLAQKTVGAGEFYTVDDDGLAQDWAGSVWMNPPYAAGLIDRFIEKLCRHFIAGDVPMAIVLVNNSTDTAWFQSTARCASAVCFPSGRIKFIDEEGKASGAPLQGQAILYLGSEPHSFVRLFEAFGFCAFVGDAL